MVAVSYGVLVLLLSFVSVIAILAYELRRDADRTEILGWMLVYVGILPPFLSEAFDLATSAERAVLLLAFCSLLAGFGLVWTARRS